MKRALIVGINYPGTSNELRGCVNDANLINKVITEQYGFSDVRMLLDGQATTDKILSSLRWLVGGAKAGDVIYFHYSGHGSQVLCDDGEEADGLDEIICPVDLDWDKKIITDDQLKEIFDTVVRGVNLTVTLDCCNSGGALDQANQYQSLGQATREGAEGRYIPNPNYTEQQLNEGEQRLGFKRKALQRNVDATGLLISGSQSHQTSADAYIDGGYIGACTYYLVENLKKTGWSVDYKSLVDGMNADLSAAGYSQRPELNGSGKLFGDEFLKSTGTIPGGDVTVAPSKPSKDDDKDDDDKGKNKKILMLAAAAIVVAVIVFGING